MMVSYHTVLAVFLDRSSTKEEEEEQGQRRKLRAISILGTWAVELQQKYAVQLLTWYQWMSALRVHNTTHKNLCVITWSPKGQRVLASLEKHSGIQYFKL